MQLIVRGDRAYARDDIMSWCEARKIDYAFGLAGNERLVRMSLPLQEKAQAQYQQRQQHRWNHTFSQKLLALKHPSYCFPKFGISHCNTAPSILGVVLAG